jgi:predicted acylesterase/phospholipase RssA
MPKIIAGSSAGSIIASFLATRPIEEFFDEGRFCFDAFANKKRYSLWRQLKRFGKYGFLMDITVLKQFMRDNIGDYTFQEAFDKFGWILNITVTGLGEHDEDRLLNYLTAPNVLIWSASAASCAIPYVYGSTDLYCKDHEGKLEKYILMNRQFVDGSIGHDLPMNKLSIFFNVNNFIVSQTNPYVIPFMDYTEEFKSIDNPLIVQTLLFLHRIKEFALS